jgi:type II secretory pathway pseudopilin PulG
MKDLNSKFVMQPRAKQEGFGALEVMIALMVSALVIIGAVLWYPKLVYNRNNSNELENLSSLTTNTRQLKTSSGYGASGANLVPALIASGGVPDGMQQSGGAVFNVWGGGVTAVSTGTGYTITYAGMPIRNCIFLATNGASSSAITTSLNGGTAITGEVTSAAATAGCTSATNSISWSGR